MLIMVSSARLSLIDRVRFGVVFGGAVHWQASFIAVIVLAQVVLLDVILLVDGVVVVVVVVRAALLRPVVLAGAAAARANYGQGAVAGTRAPAARAAFIAVRTKLV